MNVNKVIDSLKNHILPNSNFRKINSKEYLKEFIPLIEKSMKFDLGNYREFEKIIMTKKELKSDSFSGKLFTEEYAKVRLPYPVCWFEFTDSDNYPIMNEKRCMMVWEMKDENSDGIVLGFKMFEYTTPEIKMWVPNEFTYFIYLNREIDDRDNIDKSMLLSNNIGRVYVPFLTDTPPEEILDYQDHASMASMFILNRILVLLSCRNIKYEKKFPSRVMNMIRNKKKTKDFVFHTLKIALPKSYVKYKNHIGTKGEVSIHLCMGHSKHYTEKPLFGKWYGWWFWPAQIRGRKEAGVVIKDYSIHVEV
jgi:hypothetical protein